MGWLGRELTYAGDSTIYLTPEEWDSWYLIVRLDLLSWPTPSFANFDWRPAKSVFGRLTTSHRGLASVPGSAAGGPTNSVIDCRLIHYVNNLLYHEHLSFKQETTILLRLVSELLDEVEDSPLSLSPTELLFRALGLILSDTSSLADVWPAPLHIPTEYRLSTHPEAIWRWTILHWDAVEGNFQSVDPPSPPDAPGGPGPGAPPGPSNYQPPIDEPPTPEDLPPVDEPPANAPLEDFQQPPGDPPVDPSNTTSVDYWVVIETLNLTDGRTGRLLRRYRGPLVGPEARPTGTGSTVYFVYNGGGSEAVLSGSTSSEWTSSGWDFALVSENPGGNPF